MLMSMAGVPLLSAAPRYLQRGQVGLSRAMTLSMHLGCGEDVGGSGTGKDEDREGGQGDTRG